MSAPEQRNTPVDEQPGIENDPDSWVDVFGDVLFRDAMVRLGDRVSAADAVQEALLAAMRGVEKGQFDGRVPFRNWLRAILRNKVVDQLRKVTRERPFDMSDADGVAESLLYKMTGIATTKPDSWSFDFVAACEREEFWSIFEGCMSNLRDAQRSAFSLKVLDGLETEEVCKILDIQPNYLGVLLHRARQSLRDCLESKWFGSD